MQHSSVAQERRLTVDSSKLKAEKRRTEKDNAETLSAQRQRGEEWPFAAALLKVFQNGKSWYTPPLFSYEWQIQDLRATSLYEWQGKDLKQLCFQRFAGDSYEWQTKGLQRRHFRRGDRGRVKTERREPERSSGGDIDWHFEAQCKRTRGRIARKYTACQLLSTYHSNGDGKVLKG